MSRKVILGSASPRRRELLAQIGARFEARTSGREEVYHSTVPEEIVRELAIMKAENVAEDLADEQGRTPEDTIVIGADTIVVLDGKILGKPKDEKDAADMIRALQGGAMKSIPVWRFWTMTRRGRKMCPFTLWGQKYT